MCVCVCVLGGAAGRAAHATNAPRLFIKGRGEALLLKIDQDVNTGAQRYTVRYAAEPQETDVIDQSQIRRLQWGLYGRLKLRPFPRVLGEEPCSYYGRRLLYDQSHSTEEVQRCLARLCREERDDNAFCAYGEHRGSVDPPGGVDAVVRGIGKVLAKFCKESPEALESEICQVYRQLTRACSEQDAPAESAEPTDRCHAARAPPGQEAADLPQLFGQAAEGGTDMEPNNTTAETRNKAPDLGIVRDRTACRKACAAKAKATCGGKAEPACRAWSECEWNPHEDACYGRAELACHRDCADVAAKAVASRDQEKEADRAQAQREEAGKGHGTPPGRRAAPREEEGALETKAREDAQRVEDLRQAAEASQGRVRTAAQARSSGTHCSGQKSPEACVSSGCKWYQSNSKLSAIARRLPGMGERGQPRCMSTTEYENMWWKGLATDAEQMAQEDATALANAEKRAAASERELKVAQLECKLDTEGACTDQDHCGWLKSTAECKTKDEWKRQANAFSVTGASREAMCTAGGGTWTKGWRGYETGGTCTG